MKREDKEHYIHETELWVSRIVALFTNVTDFRIF